ncbi:MAG: YihY/virulence factor BrkB family protein [Oscillospiraceae bacterium]|nr:YihY/virulence factor BrkB family protein [Oscillospiraceae bacterium]
MKGMKKPLKIAQKIMGFCDMMSADNIGSFAASAAYFFILSFFPLVMLLMSLLRYTNLTRDQLTDMLAEAVPPELHSIMTGIISEVYGKTALTVSLSALVILWTAGKGFMALKNGMDIAVGASKKRNYFWLRILGTFNAVILMAVILAALALGVFGQMLEDMIEKHIDFHGDFVMFVVTFRKVIMIAGFGLLFTLAYLFTPDWKRSERNSRRKVRILAMLPGALVSSLGWRVYSALFSYYLRYSHGFENMYGSLATLIGAMFWLYGCIYLILIGLEINVFLMADGNDTGGAGKDDSKQ